MEHRRILRVLFVIGWVTVAGLLLWIHRSAWLDSDELNVCEAVFRYQIDSLEKSIPGQISAHYLTINEANPPRSLLARLRESNLKVERGSFFVPQLSEKGAWHSEIRSLERVDDRTFLVHGGYDNGPLSAAGEDYTVVKQGGRWIVEKVVGRWVS